MTAVIVVLVAGGMIGSVRMRRMAVAVVVGVGIAMAIMAAMAGGVLLVMPECHALPADDGSHSLQRNDQGEQQGCEEAKRMPRHREPFYASRLERPASFNDGREPRHGPCRAKSATG